MDENEAVNENEGFDSNENEIENEIEHEVIDGNVSSRKRLNEEEENISDILLSKRAALQSSSPSNNNSGPSYNFKVLVPTEAVGNIIGKGGSIIHELNATTGAKIHVSSNTDLYPGTKDRTVGMYGPKSSLEAAIVEVVVRIVEGLDNKHGSNDSSSSKVPVTNNSNTDAQKYELRFPIPSSASGMIIGRGGTLIKELGEKSSCYLKVSENVDPYDTKERILTIKGPNGVAIATAAILALNQMLTEPSLAVYSNPKTTYEIRQQTVAPPAQYIQSPYPNAQIQQAMYPGYPYPQPPVTPYTNALNAAALTASYNQQSNLPRPVSYLPQPVTASAPPTGTGLPEGVTAPQFSTDGTNIIMVMGIPEHLLGSVIGKSGSIIKEITNTTGAKTHVTAKGDFLPGTTQRSIKCIGNQAQVQAALNTIIAKLHAGSRNIPPPST
eukprot:CAMPEP_0196765644 /NCGR_PEP_ID=MMETSP1095-20130614/10256_1 /TAXON_ID=96789 ORGANISM="Chromulina nebulosa, Strain UTEXLB2642" /NCGR_SAMPLE_ID=MMETSP1095 /ASSEMBLY_ACC=CAM_ASM_000446 /LENGTH=438 /DNA_ID=CAMNT_0042124029 /DNA_START=14 /DNA_END=1330 /DNA_ORIENTATION=+